MTMVLENKKTDKEGYNDLYKGSASPLSDLCNGPDSYVERFEGTGLTPFCRGGNTKGYVRGMAVEKLLSAVREDGRAPDRLTVLDAGCGLGELSTFLACKGFNVIGVDISHEACAASKHLSASIGVDGRCRFFATSLEDVPVEDSSVDFVIGHASLHHFIKYEKVANELFRIMKPGAQGFFADSFGENPAYRVFHDKEKMDRLGDVMLSKALIERFFDGFDVKLLPTDWFVMLDKLFLKLAPTSARGGLRAISKLHFWLDRRIPTTSRTALALSGAIVTIVTRPSTEP